MRERTEPALSVIFAIGPLVERMWHGRRKSRASQASMSRIFKNLVSFTVVLLVIPTNTMMVYGKEKESHSEMSSKGNQTAAWFDTHGK